MGFNVAKKEALSAKELLRKQVISYLKDNIDKVQEYTTEDLKDVLKKINHGDDDDLEWFIDSHYRENMVFNDWVGHTYCRVFKIKNKYIRFLTYKHFSLPSEYCFVKEIKTKIITYEYKPIE
jgi:carboxypeptidase C (cathepsin A)